MSVYDDPSLNPVATSRASPTCGFCAKAAAVVSTRGADPGRLRGVSPGALGFFRDGDRLIPACRMHGGMSAPVSLREGMAAWVIQDTLES